MQNLKITCPEGYEIDTEKSTFFEIVFKQIENKYPINISQVNNRHYYTTGNGTIINSGISCGNHSSSKEREEQLLALRELLELKDAWNKIDDFTPDFSNNTLKYTIFSMQNEIRISAMAYNNRLLSFATNDTAELFLQTFKTQIELCKSLL